MNICVINPSHNGLGLRIGIVWARFNQQITELALNACLEKLKELGVEQHHITILSVPGALELGVTLSHLACSYKFDALIALGTVIRGETYHFEIVSNQSASAITQIALENAVPIANGVLTTHTEEQALERAVEKGRDCALVAIEMVNLLADVDIELKVDEDFDDE